MKKGLYYELHKTGELLRCDGVGNGTYLFADKHGSCHSLTADQIRLQLSPRAVRTPLRIEAFSIGRDYPAGELVRVSTERLTIIAEHCAPEGYFYSHEPGGKYTGVLVENGKSFCGEYETLQAFKRSLQMRRLA